MAFPYWRNPVMKAIGSADGSGFLRYLTKGNAMISYTDGHWQSTDGLRLHYRSYDGRMSASPLFCIPGLTRNCRDFEPLVDSVAGKRRLISVDLRGRGESAFATDPTTYAADQYAEDINALLQHLELNRFIAVGTSLGGLISMMIAPHWKKQMKGLILNDIGPEIETAGLRRIRAYLGNARSFETWMHAARAIAEMQKDIYPDYAVEDWLQFAKRTCRISGNGRIVFDYDMKIAETVRAASETEQPDLWPLYDALGDLPVLILRGANSDILRKNVATKMARRLPNATLATIARVGHAPALTENDTKAAITDWLATIR
jgi:pimeloyl-ACP methyl ester carboxylesterase